MNKKYIEDWQHFKKLLLKDSEVKKEYDRLGPEYAAIKKIIKLRLTKKMTQKVLAKKMGTTQSAMSRFEQGAVEPSLSFLSRLADVFNKKLIIDFQ